uniref:Transmembrane protein 67 n=1 Tax=Mastacembelus armatus TaxID=205130 RepID=A0A7N8YET2_9TELE
MTLRFATPLLTMATGTLLFVVNRHKVPLTLFLLIYTDLLHCQHFVVTYKSPSDCGVEEYFDISSLSCVKCGPNQRRRLSCICKTGYQTLTTDKTSITCQQCPTDQPAVTKDGFGCIRCSGILSDMGTCQCPPGNVLVERDNNGNLLSEARCEMCNGNSSAFSVPNSSGDRYWCERCQASFITTSCACNSPNILVSSTNLLPSTLTSSTHTIYVTDIVTTSVYLQVFSNMTACQALGNMCVMNMHSFGGLSNDACGLFNTIFRSRAAAGSTQDISYWRANLPWLYYGEEPGLASRVLQTNPIPTGFSFSGGNMNTEIKLLAVVYNVRGEFLRWEQVGGGNLQLCPEVASKQAAAFSFGTAYQESVKPRTSPFLCFTMFDLCTDSMKDWYLSRRMFLVDTLSGREKSITSQPKVIRVASSLVPRTREGQIFPPLMTVTYSDIPITDINTQTVSVSRLRYEMDQSEARIKTDTALGVMGGVAVLYSLLKTISWKRRIASPLIDVMTMLKFALFYAGDLANVFFAVTVGTGLYWLIFYKAQQFVSVLLPLPHQEKQFVTYIGCAFALKAVQFLHKLSLQVSIDIFLIDWERPRNKVSRTVQELKRDPAPVSIWRTYFVANEWNEIQTIRKISPTFQIMTVLFFLEVLGFSNLALRDPWPNLQRSSQTYTPSYSLTLRYGLAATLWLCIGLLQVIFFTVFHERFVEDKIRQFVDLCSISNISVLLLSHRCFGYYIHGRSVHGHADTNMEEMNSNLKREGESLCGQRGLLPNTEIQSFQVSLTNHLRSQYDRIRESLSKANIPSRLMDTSMPTGFEQKIRLYHTMNHFLGSVIDHAHPDMDYIVKDKLMFERVIGMEFLEASEKSIFYNDEAHSFSDMLFYGNESTLLIFDTLFFCVVDLGSQSFVLAAVLTYVQQMIFCLIRNILGRKNLAKKTMVDERFLI